MLHLPAEILGAPSTRSWDFLLLRVRELAVPPLREARRAERQLNQSHHKYWCRNSMGHRAVWPIRDAGRGKECSGPTLPADADRKSTRLNSSHGYISYAVFCL